MIFFIHQGALHWFEFTQSGQSIYLGNCSCEAWHTERKSQHCFMGTAEGNARVVKKEREKERKKEGKKGERASAFPHTSLCRKSSRTFGKWGYFQQYNFETWFSWTCLIMHQSFFTGVISLSISFPFIFTTGASGFAGTKRTSGTSWTTCECPPPTQPSHLSFNFSTFHIQQ